MELCAAEYWAEWLGYMLSCQLPKGHTHAHIDYGVQWANVEWITRRTAADLPPVLDPERASCSPVATH